MQKAIIILLLLVSVILNGQDYTFGSLQQAAALPELSKRNQQVDLIWEGLKKAQYIPFIYSDTVVFLYRGQATSVQWMGDFNGWGYDKNFKTYGKQLASTNIWYLKCRFPKDARLDYKIIVNDKDWIVDPDNPHQQWSGVGGGSPNSELRMPLWKEDAWLTPNETGEHGKTVYDILFTSQILGYQLTYSVYLPATINSSELLPVIYVTDGYEYLHPKMGNMTTILDNLITAKKIQPVIAVFVDHREPVNRTNNKRMEELAMSTKYLTFFTEEFIPSIESNYPVKRNAEHRAILGTSMGGLSAAYFLFSQPSVFSMAGIQSPAFYTRPQIYSLCNNPSQTKIKISMTSGLINDTSEGGQKMKSILESNSCSYTYREVNEGHSCDNWRNLIDDILIDFFQLP